MFNCSRIVFALLMVAFGFEAAAHVRFTVPVPRSQADGLKTPPCGNIPRTAQVTELRPGQVMQISWTEVINHPGFFSVDISQANDQNFQEIWRFEDNQNTVGSHNFTGTITIPNITCANCTIRLIQHMLEDPNMPSLYYSCSDISIAADSGGTVTLPSQPGGNGDLGGSGGKLGKPGQMAGGCGLVARTSDRSGGGPTPPMVGFILMSLILPLITWHRLGHVPSRVTARRRR
ncbi:MAG: SCE4755 family polysaccharide monooxygenase-like protein [Bdellovibrionales bacterium]